MNYPLGIAAPNIGVRSETFIRRHMMDLLPGGTVVIARATFPDSIAVDWRPPGPVLDMSRARSSRLRWQLVRATAQKLRFQPDKLKVKRFLKSHGVTVLMGEYLDLSLQWFEVAQKLGIPFFAHAHGIDVSQRLRESKWRAEYLRYNEAHGVITMSRVSRERLIELGLDPHKIHAIHYGVDVPVEPEIRKDGDVIRCLAVGRMVSKKAPILLLDAFRLAAAECPKLSLDYVGAGPLLPAAQQFIHANNLSRRVTLHSGQPNVVVQELMKQADIFIQHSITDPETGDEEGLPVAVLEAMAQGLPVVSTRHAGIPEAVEHNITGLLVDEGDNLGMAECIATLGHDADMRHRLGAASWRRAKQHFSWERERSELLKVLGLTQLALTSSAGERSYLN